MYGRSVTVPDGNHFELMWMDPATAEEGAAAIDTAMQDA